MRRLLIGLFVMTLTCPLWAQDERGDRGHDGDPDPSQCPPVVISCPADDDTVEATALAILQAEQAHTRRFHCTPIQNRAQLRAGFRQRCVRVTVE